MASLTSDSQLQDWRVLVQSFAVLDRLRSAGVASNAIGRDWKRKAQVLRFVVGREVPRFSCCVIGNGCLKEVIAPAHDWSCAIRASPNDVCKLFRMSKDFPALGVEFVFSLKDCGFARPNFVMAVGVLIKKLYWSAGPARLNRFSGQRSGVAHVSTRVGVVDCEVT